jgi:ribosomal protein S18 acetylase RimI-like enzyme
VVAWTIRAATADDAQAIVALVHRFNVEDGHPPGGMTADAFRALSFGTQPRIRTRLVEAAGKVLGYALFYPSYDTDIGAKGFYLQDLYVLPEARRQGIGRALMAAVARACEADGGCYLFWNALEHNHAGRVFYRRIGAREERVVTLSLQPDALQRLARDG